MLVLVAVLASLVFAGWLIYHAIKQKPVKAHTVTRVIAYVVGIFTFAFFLQMDIPLLFKVVISILLGMVLIIIAAYLQRHHQESKT